MNIIWDARVPTVVCYESVQRLRNHEDGRTKWPVRALARVLNRGEPVQVGALEN